MSYGDSAIKLPNYEDVKHECLPLPEFDSHYRIHPYLGKIYSLLSNSWLLVDAKGCGDDNSRLLTKLKRNDGKSVHVYEYWAVFSAVYGESIEKLMYSGVNGEKMEIDHIDNLNPRLNCISNLRLVNSKMNKKNSKDRHWNKVRLSMDVAQELREEFKTWTGGRVQWYRDKGKELGVTARSIQNIILGSTYKEVTE